MDTLKFLNRLCPFFKVSWEFKDSSAARADINRLLMPLLDTCPQLKREREYLELLARTGGLHAHDARVSFALFGFGNNITSLLEGEPLDDGRWFRFADLMLPELDENIVFAFDLSGHDPTIYSTPGSSSQYRAYATSFSDLVERVVALSVQAQV